MLLRSICLSLIVVCVALSPSAYADENEPKQVAAEADPGPLQREAPKPAVVEKDQPQQADEAEQDAEDMPLEELSDDELRKKMRELEELTGQMRERLNKKANEEREKKQNEQRNKVAAITLPEDPTREQCEAYVEALRSASSGANRYSSSDPIVHKLRALPAEHKDLIVMEMVNRTSLRYFCNYAMNDIEPEAFRQRVIDNLPDNPDLIYLVVMNGWARDAEAVIRKKIDELDPNTDRGWFQAAVELKDPEMYAKFHEIAINSSRAADMVYQLKTLPDYDLAHTIDVCWERMRDGRLAVNSTSLAPYAAELGNVDALGVLIDRLKNTRIYYTSSPSAYVNRYRTDVLSRIDFRGSNTEIVQWYEDNKDALAYDHLRQRFVVPESK